MRVVAIGDRQVPIRQTAGRHGNQPIKRVLPVIGRGHAGKHAGDCEVGQRFGNRIRIGQPVRAERQPRRGDDRRGAGRHLLALGSLQDGGAHHRLPQLLSDIQVFRSSRYHSTGTLLPSARDAARPEPWNWKPHFWMTRRDAMFITRQRASI